MSRASHIPISQFTLLDHACIPVAAAFGELPYHVGSSAERSDWRDVDVRLILPDDEYDALFAGRGDAFWSLLCMAITEYLSRVSGLPVDFQVQQQTDASERYPSGYRNPLGAGRLYAGGPTARAEEDLR